MQSSNESNNMAQLAPAQRGVYVISPFQALQFQLNLRSMTDRPTHTDVLLGRGVATNRNPGNENFRLIVSQHVDEYVTSTKKQKMMISRSIVDMIKTKLNPPGRFLEKNPETGLWVEVDDKRALEKTAQALRDGAAPLRKQLSEGFNLDEVFDGRSSSAQKGKRHRRTKTTSSVDEIFSSSDSLQQSRPKKQRSNPGIASSSDCSPAPAGDLTQSFVQPNAMWSMMTSQQQGQSVSLPPQPFASSAVPSQDMPSMPQHLLNNDQALANAQSILNNNQALTNALTFGLASHASSNSNPTLAFQSVSHGQVNYNASVGGGTSLPMQPVQDQPVAAPSTDAILSALQPFSSQQQQQQLTHVSLVSSPAASRQDSLQAPVATSSCSPTPPTTDSSGRAMATSPVVDQNAGEDEFEREMGADETFYGLGSSEPIGEGNFEGDDDL